MKEFVIVFVIAFSDSNSTSGQLDYSGLFFVIHLPGNPTEALAIVVFVYHTKGVFVYHTKGVLRRLGDRGEAVCASAEQTASAAAAGPTRDAHR